MKRVMTALTLASVLGVGIRPAVAGGDKGWATAGKILTGFVAAEALAHALSHGPVYQTAIVYPAPPVYIARPVYVQPAPVVLYPPPVAYAPLPPVVYTPAVPVCPPAPILSFHVGFGHSHHHPIHYQPHPPYR
jgi:hypothetical protein